MRLTYSLLCGLCLLCFTYPPSTTAHPHMFFMMRPHVIYDATGVQEIEVEWEMDELNSELLIGDCDTNKNFAIDEEEMPLVRKNYSDVFAKDNFCVTGYIGKSQEPIENLTATLKQAYIRSRKARFVISIAYPIPFTWRTQILALAFSQPGTFTSFVYDKDRSPRTTKLTDEETPVVQAEHRDKFPNYVFIRVGKSGAGPDGLIGIEEEDIDSLFADLQPTQSFLGNIKARFFALQAKFNQKVSHTVLQAKKGMALKMVFLIFLFALGYGLIHSAGPGHGKTFVIGFFMQHNARWYHAILFATLIATIHVSSAIILSGLFLTFLSSYSGIERLILQTQISFGVAIFIVGLGVYLLLSQIFSPHHHGHAHPHDHDHTHPHDSDHDHSHTHSHADDHEHHHDHSHPHAHEHPHPDHVHAETPADFQKSMIRMAVVAGIIPCPLSITIMLLAVTQNIYFLGLLTVGGIALGIITVLSTVGILIIKTKETLRQISDDHHGTGWAHTLHHAMDYLGAVLIILLGLGLGFLYMPTL